MARVGNIVFIPQATPGSPALIPLDEIPAEVKAEVEEIYNTLKTNAGNMRVEFDTKQELLQYALQVSSYCQQRPESLGGPIRFRKSPVRGLKDTQMAFRIADPLTEKDAATDAIRDGVEAVKAAAGEKPVPRQRKRS